MDLQYDWDLILSAGCNTKGRIGTIGGSSDGAGSSTCGSDGTGGTYVVPKKYNNGESHSHTPKHPNSGSNDLLGWVLPHRRAVE